MGTLVPGQNYDHVNIVISGWNGMHDLMYNAKFKAAEVFNRGALVSLDSNGEFVAGLASGTAMPLWANNATGDFDVDSDVGNFSATGIVGAYVATGGYEIRTTEYDTGGTYVPNTQLEADTVTAGYVTDKAIAYTTTQGECVGVVSSGEHTENYGQGTLSFWPVYLPALA
jgi:hypothetical protein